MKATRLLWLALLLAPGPALAEKAHCYILWETQCSEIHDASSRDITHHILMTDGPVRRATQTDSCDAEGPFLRQKQREQLRESFNQRLRDIDGCEPVEELDRRASERADSLVKRFQRLKKSGEHKQIHLLDPPPDS